MRRTALEGLDGINLIFRSYRIKDWFHYLGFVLLGIFFSERMHLPILPFLQASSILAYAFSLNEYFDKKLTIKFFLLPLLISMLLLLFSNHLQRIASLCFLIGFTIYSTPPLRLKRFPVITTLINSLSFSLLFLIGYWSFSTDLPLNFFLLLTLLNLIAQLIHEIVHLEEDMRDKLCTTAALLGVDGVRIIIFISSFLAIALTYWMFLLTEVNIVFLFVTTSFLLFTIHRSLFFPINPRFRILFRNFGILVGFLWLVSFLL
jgi:4-hydroxybenzoate polyprenyltransferase